MFNPDFYPTPSSVLDDMLEGETVEGRICYDPQAGSGNVVNRLHDMGAKQVLASEIEPKLQAILKSEGKCQVIGDDFLKITSDMISHVDLIVMNPPFSKGCEHVLHAYQIAPDGCKIVSLINADNLKYRHTKSREQVAELIEMYGSLRNLGECFSTAERTTSVEVGLIKLQKPGGYEQEFDGFFMDEEPEEGGSAPGLMRYDFIRDLVGRYVECIKIFDQQMETAVRLNEMSAEYFGTNKPELSISVTRLNVPVQRNEFKKAMQKDGWDLIFRKLKMEKYTTKGLKDEINKFVEKQSEVPFTMRNIYKMLEIVIGTTGSRMDKAMLEIFDKVTSHHDDNRYGLEGWKTNSHYLLTKRFIMPGIAKVGWQGKVEADYGRYGHQIVEDLSKALCYQNGVNYDDTCSLYECIDSPFMIWKDGKILNDPSYEFPVKFKSRERAGLDQSVLNYPGAEVVHTEVLWGQWFDWGFFRCRCYKKGTMHMEFKDEKVWMKFNRHIAKLKGYPLPEQKEQTAYQQKQNGRKPSPKQSKPHTNPVVLATIKIKKA